MTSYLYETGTLRDCYFVADLIKLEKRGLIKTKLPLKEILEADYKLNSESIDEDMLESLNERVTEFKELLIKNTKEIKNVKIELKNFKKVKIKSSILELIEKECKLAEKEVRDAV